MLMSESDLILAVDIGTGATKAVLFDSQLQQIALLRKHYPILVPSKGWGEQEPETIFQAVLAAIRDSLANVPAGYQIRAIVFSSQLYSVLAVGLDGQPLTNSIPWSDTRCAEIVQQIRQHPDAGLIHQHTGCPIASIYPLAKIRWIKENLRLPQEVRFITIKEYILYRLTGRFVVDWAMASATGLFNIHLKQWDELALSLLGITAANLSPSVSPRTILDHWNEDVRKSAGIPYGMPLVIGGGDGQLASLGVGAATSNALAVNVGTSAAARAVIGQPQVDPQGRLWTYIADDDLFVIGGMVSSGGIVFEWFLNNFFSGQETLGDGNIDQELYTYVDRLASDIPPGAEGLLFIPYLSGAQAPDWSPLTRGSFTGLDLRHQRGHFTRAVLEGITRSVYRISETIESLQDRHFEEVYVTGGLTASKVWLQIAADMFNAVIAVPETAEGSARGAAMLAMISLGMRSGLEDFQGLFVPSQRILPDETASRVYQEQHRRFLHILAQIRGSIG